MRLKILSRVLLSGVILLSNLSNSRAKLGPECSKRCGNITIPFPLGIEENFYLDKSYIVSCNTTSGKARIKGMNVDVIDLSLEGHLRVISPVASICYNQTHWVPPIYPTANLSRFPLLVDRNMITTLGCDTRGNIKANCSVLQASCSTMPEI